MKLTPVIISVILASSALGYGFASAQTPCSASYPCTKICGDHPCAPGEVYTAGGQASANATAKTAATTKSSGAPSMQTQVNISANVTATKTSSSMNGTGSMNVTSTVPPPAPVQSPEKQVSSGTAPADVKCSSGFQLVLNKFDSRPACVTPDVMAKLISRGWAASS